MSCNHQNLKKVTRSKAKELKKSGMMVTCDEGTCICAKNNISCVIYECVNCGWLVYAICQPCYDLKRNRTIINQILGNYTEADLKRFVSESMSLDTLRKLKLQAEDVLDVTEENIAHEAAQNTVDLT